MFAPRYFPVRYFPARYFPPLAGASVLPEAGTLLLAVHGTGGAAPEVPVSTDIRVSWLEFDTGAPGGSLLLALHGTGGAKVPDIRVSWLEFDTAAAAVSTDVRVSWLEFDTAALADGTASGVIAPLTLQAPTAGAVGESTSVRRGGAFKRIQDTRVRLGHARVRTLARPLFVRAYDPERKLGTFDGAMVAPEIIFPVAPIAARAPLPINARITLGHAAARARARNVSCLTTCRVGLPGATTVTAARAAQVFGSARVLLGHAGSATAARDFDDVYALRDIEDDDLLLLVAELLD